MSFAEFDTVSPHTRLPSRVALALAHAAVDSDTQSRLFSAGSTVPDTDKDKVYTTTDYVQLLISQSQNAWNEFTNYPFPQNLGKGTAALNGFRHYMIQDASYLEYYYRANAEVVSRTGTFKEISEFATKFAKSLGYVTDARSDCTEKLGVPAEDVAQEPQSQALKNSIDLYKRVVNNQSDNWLDLHIIYLPCILGYNVIAKKLLSDPDTIRNTVYFPLWVEAMASGSSAQTYTTFINSSISKLSDADRNQKWSGWVKNFAAACETEKGFFGLGDSHMFPAYKIVSDGTYKIRSYLKGNPYLVANGSSVTIQSADPGDQGKWILTNSTNGYTIQNSGKFLAASIGDAGQVTHQVNLTQEQPWSINLAGVTDKDGHSLYQLLIPNGLQWVLDAGSPSKLQAFVANNSKISSQFWLLEKA